MRTARWRWRSSDQRKALLHSPCVVGPWFYTVFSKYWWFQTKWLTGLLELIQLYEQTHLKTFLFSLFTKPIHWLKQYSSLKSWSVLVSMLVCLVCPSVSSCKQTHSPACHPKPCPLWAAAHNDKSWWVFLPETQGCRFLEFGSSTIGLKLAMAA